MTYLRIASAFALSAALALSACQKKEEAPAADAAAAPEAAAPAAADAAAPAAASGVPAECQAYLDLMEACAKKIEGMNAAAAAQVRQGAEATRSSWAAVPDQAALAGACKTATDTARASNAAMGC